MKKSIKKSKLLKKLRKKLGLSKEQAKQAYELILHESPAFRKKKMQTTQLTKEKAVPVKGEAQLKEVSLKTEVPVEVINEIVVLKEVEVIKEVPVEVEKKVEVIKEVKVEVEVPVIVEKEIIKEVEVIKEVPIEIIKEVTLIKEVEIIKEIEVIKEIPIEIIKEVEVVKSIDMDLLKKQLMKLDTVEISKNIVGETRNTLEAKIVERRELPLASSSEKETEEDDLKKIEGIGPKIEELLNHAGVLTFKKLSKTNVEKLSEILSGGGPRFQMHNPESWPFQAGLAAKGKWEELKKWQDEAINGRMK